MSSEPTPVKRPKAFYRVQHDRSFTLYDDDGFEARGHYTMDCGHWINRRKLEQHLNWNDRSPEPSPFISVFDNHGERWLGSTIQVDYLIF